MVRIHKTAEYALIALKHMRDSGCDAPVSAKELSERYKLPYELVSKVLQRLASGRVLNSRQGVLGGYLLGPRAADLTVLELSALTDPSKSRRCGSGEQGAADDQRARYACDVYSTCTILAPVADLGRRIEALLGTIRVFDLLDGKAVAGIPVATDEPQICCKVS
ncbi:MAG TPA: Rrf2 family transcriptional regulator [Spirochaetia bacterium]|nr:Rrf2 family transcriptional regulator [Spirochaetia bacterium]